MKRAKLREAPRQTDDREDKDLAGYDLEYAHHERLLQIDKHDLDGELGDQPRRFAKVAELYAELVSLRDLAKDEVKTTEAAVSLDLRKLSDAQGVRTTEKTIEAKTLVDERRRKAFRRYALLVAEVERWEGMKGAFQERSYILRELGNLWIAGYFSNTSVRAGASQVDDAQVYDNKQAAAVKRRELAERRRGRE